MQETFKAVNVYKDWCGNVECILAVKQWTAIRKKNIEVHELSIKYFSAAGFLCTSFFFLHFTKSKQNKHFGKPQETAWEKF